MFTNMRLSVTCDVNNFEQSLGKISNIDNTSPHAVKLNYKQLALID